MPLLRRVVLKAPHVYIVTKLRHRQLLGQINVFPVAPAPTRARARHLKLTGELPVNANKIQQALHPEYYHKKYAPTEFGDKGALGKVHIDHCLKSLRQSITCASDVSPII
ncbi:hypothetical protein G3M48_007135 [Beauveria asiatica]|uniref:Uncharacterized protein n=1 Tax=Beauveria asiatica TaxID=1069075 RepID=A0AAW0S4L7_9HYPO